MRWYPANPPLSAPCRLPESRTIENAGAAGQRTYVYRYSQTKAALLNVNGQADLIDAMLAAGAPMLAAAEAEAAPCPGAAGAPAAQPPQPPATPAPQAGTSAATAPSTNVDTSASDAAGEAIVSLLDGIRSTATEDDASEAYKELLRRRKGPDSYLGVGVELKEVKAEYSAFLGNPTSLTPLQRRVGASIDLAVVGKAIGGDGKPIFPAVNAAAPVLARMAAKATEDPRMATALDAFLDILYRTDLIAAQKAGK